MRCATYAAVSAPTMIRSTASAPWASDRRRGAVRGTGIGAAGSARTGALVLTLMPPCLVSRPAGRCAVGSLVHYLHLVDPDLGRGGPLDVDVAARPAADDVPLHVPGGDGRDVVDAAVLA